MRCQTHVTSLKINLRLFLTNNSARQVNNIERLSNYFTQQGCPINMHERAQCGFVRWLEIIWLRSLWDRKNVFILSKDISASRTYFKNYKIITHLVVNRI